LATVYWMDSCGAHYSDAYTAKKWTSGNASLIDTTGGYDGRPCIKLNIGTGSGGMSKAVGQNFATLAIGARLLPTQLDTACHVALLDGSTHQIGAYLNSSGYFEVRRGGSGGALLATSSIQTLSSNWVYVELKATINDTTGSFELKINGATAASGSSVDTKQSANAYANTLYIGFRYNTQKLMDVYVASDFLGDVKVLYLPPVAAGTTGAWTASTGDPYACVDETTTPNTADYIESGTPGNISTFAMTDISGTGSIHAVQSVMLAAKTDAGARSAKCVLRAGGADQEGATTHGIGDTATYFFEVWNVDPSDSNPWTVTDINALEVGVKDQA
jgi:hypothetical protein